MGKWVLYGWSGERKSLGVIPREAQPRDLCAHRSTGKQVFLRRSAFRSTPLGMTIKAVSFLLAFREESKNGADFRPIPEEIRTVFCVCGKMAGGAYGLSAV
ncbi:MAG: hypothetical protein IKP32_02170 [Clostridia bacterium]|nr:hypothetical protein [Clostridia bacterium]